MQTDLKQAMARVLTHQEEAITTAQKTAYWLAKENVATRKFGSLMKLLRQAGCPNIDKLDCAENAKYMSNQAAEEFQDACAVVIAKEIERPWGGGGYFLIRGYWGCAAGWGRIFTTGLTIMGLHF